MTRPSLVDTHCHLTLLEQRGLLDAAIEGAAAAGVDRVVTVGVNLPDSDRSREIAEAHASVYFSVGWDPQQPAPPQQAELRALDELLQHPRAVAVGEVGLDTFMRPGYHETPLEVQQRSLRVMLELAVEHAKPVIIHDRDAHDEIIAALADVPAARGVMHCFTGDRAHAMRSIDAGFAISFSGIVTFRNAGAIQDAAKFVPNDRFVVETDAPFLTPVPFRGETNIPARVAVTAAAVAALRGVSADDVRSATTSVAERLFDFSASQRGGA